MKTEIRPKLLLAKEGQQLPANHPEAGQKLGQTLPYRP